MLSDIKYRIYSYTKMYYVILQRIEADIYSILYIEITLNIISRRELNVIGHGMRYVFSACYGH